MGLHRWLMCFGQRLRGSRPRRKIGADTLKPRRALGKTWEQAPTAFEAAQLIKPPALRGASDSPDSRDVRPAIGSSGRRRRAVGLASRRSPSAWSLVV